MLFTFTSFGGSFGTEAGGGIGAGGAGGREERLTGGGFVL